MHVIYKTLLEEDAKQGECSRRCYIGAKSNAFELMR